MKTICPAGATIVTKTLVFLSALLLLASCQKNSCELDPSICYAPPQRVIEQLPSAFPKLSNEERNQDWGKELHIANRFARELDLYRAVTAYKRALILIPKEASDRRLQIEYGIVLSYYLGGKYQEAIETFEAGDLIAATPAFPVFGDLLVMLYDAYNQDCRFDRAEVILELIKLHSPETAAELRLYHAVMEGEIARAEELAQEHPNHEKLTPWLDGYCGGSKSVRKAQWLNGILPGAGYTYVGQKQTAMTSFLLNTLFTAAAAYFFCDGNIAAGLITTSLEAGWYLGGINGAGLAAKEYNEHLFECLGKELLVENKLFPILMFEYSF